MQFGVVLGKRAEPIGHGAQLGERCTIGLGERLERGLRPGEKARAVLQALVLGRHFVPFALARRELAQVIEPLGDVGALGFALRKLRARLRGHLLEPLPVAERLRRVARERLGSGVRVEEFPLGGCAQQRLVRVLAMQVDEPLARFLELREGGGAAIDEAARAARAVKRAAQHQAAGIAGEVALGEPRFHGFGDIELAGELGALGALAHEGGVGAAADQQLDRVHQDGFAGAGLAGERGEARRQLERSVLDQHQVADFKRAQHLLVLDALLAPAELLAQRGEVAVARRMDEAHDVG